MIRSAVWVCLLAAPVWGNCVGGTAMGSFRLAVAGSGGTLPLRSLDGLAAGQTLRYEPVRLPGGMDKAEVALILVHGVNRWTVYPPQSAAQPAEWLAPEKTSVIALVVGPRGLHTKKIVALVDDNQEVLTQLADYAAQTSQVEALVEALAARERSGAGVEAALAGFSSRYGVAMPRLDPHAPTDQQAALLLRALLPSLAAYDPLAPTRGMVQQSAGLAASVASLFFGSSVGLAAGGAMLFQNLRGAMFPDTEFRSAIAQAAGDALALCAKPQPSKPRTRLAYLWAHRLPLRGVPSLVIAGDSHVPLGAKSRLKVNSTRWLEHARRWRLGGQPVEVRVAGADALEIDLRDFRAGAGAHRLTALWDWETLEAAGDVRVSPFADLGGARVATTLVEGSGAVRAKVTGADFRFLEKVELGGVSLPFQLGPQSFETEIDTAAQGAFHLVLAQSDGVRYEIPFRVLPPHPRLAPVRANLGEAQQTLVARGDGLERIEAVYTEAGQAQWSAGRLSVRLRGGVGRGQRFDLRLKVRDVPDPVSLPEALEIAGPRPRIASLRRSAAQTAVVELRPEEIPAGDAITFALEVQHVDAAPEVTVTCAAAHPRIDRPEAALLFVTVTPAAAGPAPCELSATVSSAEGDSDPYPVGRVLRLPRIEAFELTDQKLAEQVYAGILKGSDLDTIERTGWNADLGLPVPSIPVAEAGGKQTLRVALPWPSPSPRAPVYIWLRGEDRGRATVVKY